MLLFWGTLIEEKFNSQDYILLKHSLALVQTWIPLKKQKQKQREWVLKRDFERILEAQVFGLLVCDILLFGIINKSSNYWYFLAKANISEDLT